LQEDTEFINVQIGRRELALMDVSEKDILMVDGGHSRRAT
ncbi:unnamed protein product, partial [marine sediment metagenome]